MGTWKRRLAVFGGTAAAFCVLVMPLSAEASVSATWSPQTSAGAFDFGTVTPGQTVVQKFTLTNTGSSQTPTLHIKLSGSGDFRKGVNRCEDKRLKPGGSCLVAVRYTGPTAPDGTDTTTLQAQHSGQVITSITLTGSSGPAPPNLVITPTTAPDLFDFGTATGTQDFTLTNTGGTTAQFLTLFGGYDGPLVVQPTIGCVPSLAPGAQCTLSTGTYTAGACGTTTYSTQTGVDWNTATDSTQHTTEITVQAEDPAC